MKKTLLHKEAVEEISERVQKLTPGAARLWGKMNATEMLYHCNLANQFILADRSDYRRPTGKQRLIKFICFYLLPRLPKHNPQPARIDAKGKIDKEKFAEQQKLYTATLKQFAGLQRPLRSLHPRMGYLTNDEWGRIAWMHMDHHLRQFGV